MKKKRQKICIIKKKILTLHQYTNKIYNYNKWT